MNIKSPKKIQGHKPEVLTIDPKSRLFNRLIKIIPAKRLHSASKVGGKILLLSLPPKTAILGMAISVVVGLGAIGGQVIKPQMENPLYGHIAVVPLADKNNSVKNTAINLPPNRIKFSPQVLGLSTIKSSSSNLTPQIKAIIDQYIKEGKLKGEKGDKGDPGTSNLATSTQVSYLKPNLSQNFTGGSFFSVTNLSSQNNISQTENVNNLIVSGNASLPTTTVTGSINASQFLKNGIPFEGASQWTTDGNSNNIFYNLGRVSIGSTSSQSIFSVAGSSTLGTILPQTAGVNSAGVVKKVVDTNRSYSPSIAIASDGFARISYVSYNSPYPVEFARCTDADCSSPIITTVAASSGGAVPGAYSMVLGADGFATILYEDSSSSLTLARCLDSDCASRNLTTLVTDDNTNYPGYYGAIIKLGSDGFPRIGYNNYGDNTDHFIICSDADCSSPVDNTVATNVYGYYGPLGMDLDSGSLADISYEDYTTGNLMYVHCLDSACSTTSSPQVVDGVSNYPAYLGQSLLVGSDNFARIVYVDDNDNLHYLICNDVNCSSPQINSLPITNGSNYYGLGFALRSGDLASIGYDPVGGSGHILDCQDAACSSYDDAAVDTGDAPNSFYYGDSLAIGHDGLPRIAWADYDVTGVQYARLTNIAGSSININGSNIGDVASPFGQVYAQGVNAINVGVGTATPAANLDIFGNGGDSSGLGGYPTVVRITSVDETPWALDISRENAATGTDIALFNGGDYISNSTTTGSWVFGVGAGGGDYKYPLIADKLGTVFGYNTSIQNAISLYDTSGSRFGYVFATPNVADSWSLGYGTNRTIAGTPAITWNNSGNVGIGTSSPTSALTVNGDINFTGTLYQNGTPFSGGINLQNNPDPNVNSQYLELGGQENAPVIVFPNTVADNDSAFIMPVTSNNNYDLRLYLQDDQDDSEKFSIWGGSCALDGGCTTGTSTAQEQFHISAAGNGYFRGNVGIGNNNPSYALDVNGDINFTGNLLQNGSPFVGSQWNTATDTQDIFYTAGGVGIGTSSLVANLTIQGSFNNSTTSALTTFNSDGTRIFNLSSNGSLAVGPYAGVNNLGADTTIFGNQAGYNNSGSSVNLLGNSAGVNNQGSVVDAFGPYAGAYNTGNSVNAFGNQAAYNNTGHDVNFIGDYVGYGNTGNAVNGLGPDAVQYNTGNNVNALGDHAAYFNFGSNVNAFGLQAAEYNAGLNINAIGNSVLSEKIAGDSVTAIGDENGGSYLGGAQKDIQLSVLLGSTTYTHANSDDTSTPLTNIVAIQGVATQSNEVVLGNDSVEQTLLYGKVGIGTANPSAKLTIDQGSGAGDPFSGTSALLLGGTSFSTGGHPFMEFGRTGDTSSGVGYIQTGLAGLGEGSLALNPLGGNVGIGTSSPSQALEVQGNIKISGLNNGLYFPDGSFIGTTVGTATTTGLTSPTDLSLVADSDLNGSGEINLSTNGSPRITITNAGNVGIGETDPSMSLVLKQKSGTDGFQFTGESISGGDSGSGFLATMGYNTPNNKQLWLGDPDYLGSPSGFFNRYGTFNGYTYMDSIAGDGGAYGTLNLGTDGGSKVAIDGTAGAALSTGSNLWVNGNTSIGAAYQSNAAPSNGLLVQGAVGIGTNNPEGLLNVNGGVLIGDASDVTPGSGNELVIAPLGGSAATAGITFQHNGTDSDFIQSDGTARTMSFGGNNGTFLTINDLTGNVGIGNNAPSHTLDVSGDINFTGNLLQNGAPVSFGAASGGFNGRSMTGSTLSTSTDVSDQTTEPNSTSFSADGMHMYVFNNSNVMYQYDLASAWDVSSATYSGNSFSPSAQTTNAWDATWGPDGAKLYILGSDGMGHDPIYEYDVSPAWDLSSANYSGKSLDPNNDSVNAEDINWNSDGTKASMIDSDSGYIVEYTFSTPWDVSSGTFAGPSFNSYSGSGLPIESQFLNNGSYMIIEMFNPGSGNIQVYGYSLTEAYNPSSASADGSTFNFSSYETLAGVAFDPDGTKFYYPVEGYGPVNGGDASIAQFTTNNSSSSSLWSSSGSNIYYNSGSVSIGTTTPGAPLNVFGSAYNNDVGRFTWTSSSTNLTYDYGLGLKNTDTTDGNYSSIQFDSNDTDGHEIYGSEILGVFTSHQSGSEASDLSFLTSQSENLQESMRITSAGNVGIGTSSPIARLAIVATSTEDVLDLASSSGETLLRVSSSGNVGIGTTSTAHLLTLSGGAYSDGNTWQTVSDFNKKTNFASLNPADILQKIVALPISQWNYKTDPATTVHIGPTAQDFYATFNLGGPAGQTSIDSLDPANIALLGVQALNQKIIQLQGSLTANATTANLTVYSPSNFSGDSVGEAQIPAGQTSVRISFTQSYQYQPIVTFSAEDVFVPAFIQEKDAYGFTIAISSATTTAVTFDWHSFASPTEQLFVGLSTSSPISLVVTVPGPVIDRDIADQSTTTDVSVIVDSQQDESTTTPTSTPMVLGTSTDDSILPPANNASSSPDQSNNISPVEDTVPDSDAASLSDSPAGDVNQPSTATTTQ